MGPHLGNGYTERSRIEDGIREHEMSLRRIHEECTRLAVQLAGRNLIRGLLVSRRHSAQARSPNLIRANNRGVCEAYGPKHERFRP